MQVTGFIIPYHFHGFLPVAVLPKVCVLLGTLCGGEFSVSAWLVMEI